MASMLRGLSATIGQVLAPRSTLLLVRSPRCLMTWTPVGGLAPQVRSVASASRSHGPAMMPVSSLRASSRPMTSLRPLAARLPGRRALACAATAAPPAEETFQYQAEVDRLMDMIVNSMYSNRDVFLRELVSNASDALDKARFVSLTKADMMKGKDELEIKISADKEKNIITIEDSGIGMTREQLLSNLGTIARSGTRKFMEMMKEANKAGDNNLIGQFGVGFYSAFLVADRVTVQTRSFEEGTQWMWEANAGSHQYKVKPDTESDIVRGTRVTLHLKEDAQELCDPIRLSQLIKQYSQFISFPIKLYAPRKDPIKVLDAEATKRKQEAADKKAEEKGEEKKPVEPVMKTEYVEKMEWRVENENKPIWTRNPKDVTPEQYNEFFKQTFAEFLEPLAHVHFNVEGTIEFAALLYLPGMAPFDQNYQTRSKNIKLFVKRVFISDDFDDNLMPRYLSFIKGVVDSSDLPLNVSREILQESRIVRVIRKQLVRRSLEMLEDLAKKEGGEDYKTLWENFGRHIKMGVIEDTENREKLSKLLRFYSSQSENDMTSLEQYVSRMKPGQKNIFYMAGDSVEAAKAAPFVEKLVKKGFEVLYLTEPIDEAMATQLQKFNDHELADVSKDGLALEDDPEEKQKQEEFAKEYQPVVDFLKKSLGEKVEKVTISNRLTDSPCALVTSKFGWSANMERIMRTQALGDQRSMEYMRGRKILELNPEHDVVRGIKALLAEKDEERAKDLAELLYETALLTSGFQVESPKDYAGKVFTLMKIALGYSAAAPAASSTSEAAKPVEAEVVDPNDPWSKKQ